MVDLAPSPASVSPEERDAWKELSFLALTATIDHAIHCDPDERDAFRERLRETERALRNAATPSQILIAAGGLSHAIARYCSDTQRQIKEMGGESGSLLQGFLDHLQAIHDSSENRSLLDELRAAVKSPEASRGKQIQQHLDALLQNFQNKRHHAAELTNRLQDRVTILEQSSSFGAPSVSTPQVNGTLDACTGLPVRAEAEAALRLAVNADQPVCAAVFYLHRMALTNARFGEAIGNQVIQVAGQHIDSAIIRSDDRLFRWSGPAFLALLHRTESLPAISGEIQRTVCAPVSRFFETPSRSVYLPIKITGEIVPVQERSYAEITDQIERFVLNASGAVHQD